MSRNMKLAREENGCREAETGDLSLVLRRLHLYVLKRERWHGILLGFCFPGSFLDLGWFLGVGGKWKWIGMEWNGGLLEGERIL